MAKRKTCSKCDEPCIENQSLCAVHFAEYMREYRPMAKMTRDKEIRSQGFKDGVTACCDHLRQKVGNYAATGFQLARDLEKAHIGAETGDAKQRREFLVSLRGM